MLFSSAEKASAAIVVTSTGPGEGKTLLAANLAMALAQAGQRVLLIDADMRRRACTRSSSCTQEPGLSNVLVGNASRAKRCARPRCPGCG